jgi:hypothetical protein
MKKVCFAKLIRNNTPNLLGGPKFDWYFQNVKPFDDISEMVTSFYQFNFEIDSVVMDGIDSNTSIVLTISTIDMDDIVFLEHLKLIFNKECKKIFIDLSSYDHQDIDSTLYEWCRKECDKELYFIDKNLIEVADDILFFEHHAYHTSMYIPKFIKQYNDLNDWCSKFVKPFKGLFLAGHIRFHKVELLNYLYVNGLLEDNFIWSCTDESFQPELYREFIPERNEQEFRNFKILERIPNSKDFDLFDKWKYHNYPAHVNFMNYFNTYFEIVPETHFYHRENIKPTMDTRIDWNNVSEKSCKAIRMGTPFIMLSKPNTVKLLTDRFGFDVSIDGWNHDYDTIEDDRLRMATIKARVKDVLSMSTADLHDLYYQYFSTKNNNTIFIENFYKQPLQIIYNKF